MASATMAATSSVSPTSRPDFGRYAADADAYYELLTKLATSSSFVADIWARQPLLLNTFMIYLFNKIVVT